MYAPLSSSPHHGEALYLDRWTVRISTRLSRCPILRLVAQHASSQIIMCVVSTNEGKILQAKALYDLLSSGSLRPLEAP